MKPLSLSFRTVPVGGDVADTPAVSELGARVTNSHVLFLVHGYNNTQAEATLSYEAFLDVQANLFGVAGREDWPVDRDVVEVFWAGDGWGWAGALYYPVALQHAEETAPHFADALLALSFGHGTPLTVEFVGHSMGCRLILETMKCLRGASGIEVGRVALMAAAVPVQFLTDPSSAHSLLSEYQAMSEHGAMSLYSPMDQVLAGAFPLGETASSNEHCWMPTALGHELWSRSSTSSSGDHFDQHEVVGAGHSDYWGQNRDTRDPVAFSAGAKVRDFLQLPIGERRADTRYLAALRADDRTIDTRELGARMLDTRGS